MLKIRLQRVGRVHEPAFRLVLTDSKNSTKSGKTLEILGNYDARHAEDATVLGEKVTYWISKGAQVSDTVHNLLVTRKIITGKKINTLPLKKAIVKEVVVEAPAAPAPVAEEVAEPTTEAPTAIADEPAEAVEAPSEPVAETETTEVSA